MAGRTKAEKGFIRWNSINMPHPHRPDCSYLRPVCHRRPSLTFCDPAGSFVSTYVNARVPSPWCWGSYKSLGYLWLPSEWSSLVSLHSICKSFSHPHEVGTVLQEHCPIISSWTSLVPSVTGRVLLPPPGGDQGSHRSSSMKMTL